MDIAELNKASEVQVRLAGPRYGPSIDPTAPNIEIRPLLIAIAALGYAEDLDPELARLARQVEEGWDRSGHLAERWFKGRLRTPVRLITLLKNLRQGGPAAAGARMQELRAVHNSVERRVTQEYDRLMSMLPRIEMEGERSVIENYLSSVRPLRNAISRVSEFLDSPAFSLLGHNCMLLLGEWGTGKTHFLCDVSQRRRGRGLPTLFRLASNIPLGADPIDALCGPTGLALNRSELLRELQRLGSQNNERALLIIDGINEGDREQWRRSVGKLARELRTYPNIGLVLSCRAPFHKLIFTTRTSQKYERLLHNGFEDAEFDAQIEFFSHYGIEAPSIPFIVPEFSRPLFLKLLCEALRNLNSPERKRRFKEVASGQKGMTYILEHFVDSIGRGIEADFKVPRGTCWNILKGAANPPGGTTLSVAEAMARDLNEGIGRDECLSIVRSNTGLPAEKANDFMHRLLVDGILAEGIQWDVPGCDLCPVIQFPYQRFGDHLVARRLLDEHLNTDSETAVRRSFYIDRPLGKIFRIDEQAGIYALPGLASAIMLEFPERVKRKLNEKELVHYLPRRCCFWGPLKEAFLEGLHWRSSETITGATQRIFRRFLDNSDTCMEALEVFVVLAARPGHPYSAEELRRYLEQMGMAERDLKWSEFIRLEPSPASWERLIAWVEKNADRMKDADTRKNTMLLLALFLTTVDRDLRDRVTKTLFSLGLQSPRELFDVTVSLLGFNDPYVPERMLAASYGVTMNLWADPRGKELRSAVGSFARLILDKMFIPEAPHATSHALTKGYALGIVTLAEMVATGSVKDHERPSLESSFNPLGSPFRAPTAIADEEIEDTKPAIHMDFRNYTIGSLVRDRHNYDMEHGRHKTLLRQILGRMADLGFSYAKFEDVDREIARLGSFGRGRSPGKIDRYSKKYSWIAFFEMYGVQQAVGEIEPGSRTSDCDIDPSFPEPAPEWAPELPLLFEVSYGDRPVEWLERGPVPDYGPVFEIEEVDGIPGPWVLLDGFISQGSEEDPREVFTFLSGFLPSRTTLLGSRRLYLKHPRW